MVAARPSDVEYCHARAIEEQVAADRATCAAARERHDELAAMYRFRESFLRTYGQLFIEADDRFRRRSLPHRPLTPSTG